MNQKSLFVMGGVSLLAATAIIVTQTNCKTGGGDEPPNPSATGKTTTPPAPGAIAALVAGEDWPVWSRNGSGNLFSPETGIAANFDPGKFVRGSEEIDMSTTKNVRWAAKLGSQTPLVSQGRKLQGWQ